MSFRCAFLATSSLGSALISHLCLVPESSLLPVHRQKTNTPLQIWHFLLGDCVEDLGNVLKGAGVDWIEELGHVDVEAEGSEGVGHDLVAASVNTENVFQHQKGFAATADFVDFDAFDRMGSSFGSVIDLEGWPRAGRAAGRVSAGVGCLATHQLAYFNKVISKTNSSLNI